MLSVFCRKIIGSVVDPKICLSNSSTAHYNTLDGLLLVTVPFCFAICSNINVGWTRFPVLTKSEDKLETIHRTRFKFLQYIEKVTPKDAFFTHVLRYMFECGFSISMFPLSHHLLFVQGLFFHNPCHFSNV